MDIVKRAEVRDRAKAAILAAVEGLSDTDVEVIFGDVLVACRTVEVEASPAAKPKKAPKSRPERKSVVSRVREALQAATGTEIEVAAIRSAVPDATPQAVHDALYKLTSDPAEHVTRERSGVYLYDPDENGGGGGDP